MAHAPLVVWQEDIVNFTPPRRVFSNSPDTVEQTDAMAQYAANQAADPGQFFGVPTDVKRAAYSARVGELVICDPTNAAFPVYLPSPVIGGAVLVKNHSASSNTITVLATNGATVDQGPSVAISVPRLCIPIVAISRDEWVTVSLL
jgi:hypothetical protein